MVETIGIIILVVIGIALVSVLAFGGWLTVSVLRLIGRGFNALVGGGPPGRPRLAGGAAGRHCPRPKCHTGNVAAARFCRRCGVPLDADPRQFQPVRRSAWW